MPEKETSSRQTLFVKKWLEDPMLNICFIEVKGDITSAKSKVCRTVFKLFTMVKSALKHHSDGKKHQSEVKKMKTFFFPVKQQIRYPHQFLPNQLNNVKVVVFILPKQ